MARRNDPFFYYRAWQKTATDQQRLWLAASEVIWTRMFQIMTGTMSQAEAHRMVAEKPAAFARAAMAAGLAAASGKSGSAVVAAATRPISRKARSNANRLRRKR